MAATGRVAFLVPEEESAEPKRTGIGGRRLRRRGIPRAGGAEPEDRSPWLLNALRELIPVGVSVSFLAAGGIVAMLSNDTPAGGLLAVVAVLAGLTGAAFLSGRIAAWLLSWFE